MELLAPDTPLLGSIFDLGEYLAGDITPLSESYFLGFLFTGSPLSLERWCELDPDLLDIRLDSRASLAPLTAPPADIEDM